LAEGEFTSPEHLNYPWVEPPAAAKPITAPSGASQAFSLCENLGTGAIYLSLCCEMSYGYQKEEHRKAVLFFLVDLKGFEPTTLRMRTN